MNKLGAQQFTQGYQDSAREFFKEWPETHPNIIPPHIIPPLFMDTGYTWTMNHVINGIKNDDFEKKGLKVYKARIDSNLKTRYYTDSLILAANEIKSVIQKLKESISFNWTTEFIPIATIVNKEDFGPAYKSYVDSLKKIRPTHSYGTYPYSWVFSLPAFFRNGTICIFFYQYHYGSGGGWDIGVYKRDEGHWRFFGGISGGDY